MRPQGSYLRSESAGALAQTLDIMHIVKYPSYSLGLMLRIPKWRRHGSKAENKKTMHYSIRSPPFTSTNLQMFCYQIIFVLSKIFDFPALKMPYRNPNVLDKIII
jgi:hypothetical protein